jgi:hypothetical protein
VKIVWLYSSWYLRGVSERKFWRTRERERKCVSERERETEIKVAQVWVQGRDCV